MVLEILGAHIVQDHLDALTGDLAYGSRPVIAVGDRMVCSNGAAVVELVLATRSCDHYRPDALGVLDRERADAAGSAMDQKPVTLGKTNQLDVRVNRGGSLDDAGRGNQFHA